jgi:hypothetical protein
MFLKKHHELQSIARFRGQEVCDVRSKMKKREAGGQGEFRLGIFIL